MSKLNEPQFDHYARSYTDLHRASVSASGEEPAYFSRYKAQYMARMLAPDTVARPLTLLDFGCGIGNSIPHLNDAFPQAVLYGVDPSSESIRIAIENHSDKATFRINENLTIPYPDGYFDLIQVACVFHHIELRRRKHWMQEIRRVLKPGGCVFVFEHNVLNPLTRKAVRDCPFDEDAILLPRHELLGLAGFANFTNVRARYIVFFPSALAILRPIEPYLCMIPFGAQYVVRAIA